MNWQREGKHLIVSDSTPCYRIARFYLGDSVVFRASVKGEFIGDVMARAKEAQALCERHFLIMGAEPK